jgi:hypothetical protein
VQTAEKARNVPSAVRTNKAGSEPNLKIFPEFGLSSSPLAATADRLVDSATGGGMM